MSEITINFNSCKLEKPINDNIESDFYLLVKASREDKTILEDIFGSFLLLIPGLLFLYGGGLMFKTCLSSHKWPSIWGEITRSEVIKEKRRGRSYGNKTVYRPMVSYKYNYNNKEFTGKNEFPMQQPGDFPVKEDAEKYLKEWPLESRVRVYFDPAKPDLSCLKPGITKAATVLFAIGVGLTSLGVIGFIITLSRHFL